MIFAGLIVLACAPFSKRWCYAPWVKTAFWLALGAAFIDLAVLSFIPAYFPLSETAYSVIRTLRTLCAGIAIGMLVLFFLSGEAIRGYHRSRELRRGAYTSTDAANKA